MLAIPEPCLRGICYDACYEVRVLQARNAKDRPQGPVFRERMTGFEPATSTLARWRSSQLSYIRRRSTRIVQGRRRKGEGSARPTCAPTRSWGRSGVGARSQPAAADLVGDDPDPRRAVPALHGPAVEPLLVARGVLVLHDLRTTPDDDAPARARRQVEVVELEGDRTFEDRRAELAPLEAPDHDGRAVHEVVDGHDRRCPRIEVGEAAVGPAGQEGEALVEVDGDDTFTDASTHTLLYYNRGINLDWTEASGTIPKDGRFRFRFVNGTYDKSGYLGIGSEFYIDDVRVVSGDATVDVAEQVARLARFSSTEDDPTTSGLTRTLTLEAKQAGQSASSATSTLTFTPLTNDAPSLDGDAGTTAVAIAVTETDVSSVENPLSDTTGTLAGTDPESDAITFGISGGTSADGVSTLAGTYGTLSVTEATGAYTYEPDMAAIKPLDTDDDPVDAFTITVSDGSDSSTGTLNVTIDSITDTEPSAPTVAAVVGGDGFLSVLVEPPGSIGGSAISNYEYSIDGGAFRALDPAVTAGPVQIATESADGTTALVNGTSYAVRVRAVNDGGSSPASNSLSGIPTSTSHDDERALAPPPSGRPRRDRCRRAPFDRTEGRAARSGHDHHLLGRRWCGRPDERPCRDRVGSTLPGVGRREPARPRGRRARSSDRRPQRCRAVRCRAVRCRSASNVASRSRAVGRRPARRDRSAPSGGAARHPGRRGAHRRLRRHACRPRPAPVAATVVQDRHPAGLTRWAAQIVTMSTRPASPRRSSGSLGNSGEDAAVGPGRAMRRGDPRPGRRTHVPLPACGSASWAAWASRSARRRAGPTGAAPCIRHRASRSKCRGSDPRPLRARGASVLSLDTTGHPCRITVPRSSIARDGRARRVEAEPSGRRGRQNASGPLITTSAPASTKMTWPVAFEFAGLASHTISSATSSGCP